LFQKKKRVQKKRTILNGKKRNKRTNKEKKTMKEENVARKYSVWNDAIFKLEFGILAVEST
jgi:hypothetical protein